MWFNIMFFYMRCSENSHSHNVGEFRQYFKWGYQKSGREVEDMENFDKMFLESNQLDLAIDEESIEMA
jgi:hypothetical protein